MSVQNKSHSKTCSREEMNNVQSIVQMVTIDSKLSSSEATSQPTVSQVVKAERLHVDHKQIDELPTDAVKDVQSDNVLSSNADEDSAML